MNFKEIWDEYLNIPLVNDGVPMSVQYEYGDKLEENLDNFLFKKGLVFNEDWKSFDAKGYGWYQVEFFNDLSKDFLNEFIEYTGVSDYEVEYNPAKSDATVKIQFNNLVVNRDYFFTNP